MNKRIITLILGPVFFLLCLFLLPESVFSTLQARAAIGVVVWTAFWWVTSPVDFAVTAMVPVCVNALIGMAPMSSVIANYASETIVLLFSASVLTAVWAETGLDRRISAKILSLIGEKMRTQVAFWFILCALLSAVIPNAVVCAAIVPIAVSMLGYVGEKDIRQSSKGSLILLTIVYAIGVGGLLTPLGGAMNLVITDYLTQVTGQEYMFASWIVRFAPIFAILVISNILLLFIFCKKTDTLPGSREFFIEEYKKMPPMKKEEIISLVLFIIATVLSFTRNLYQGILPGLKPAYAFAVCALLSFVFTRKDGKRLIEWKNAQNKVVWEMMFVFAGGLALGTLINESGAADMIGEAVAKANLTGGFGTVFIIVLLTVLLSDVTSNTATASVVTPIVISIISGIGENPIPYIYITAIGINLSYLLPTSIRAIPVGYGLKPNYMLKKGIIFEIVAIVLMTLVGYFLLKYWPLFSTI
ncbi:MAG: anion permease [Lachnospiraceae bacterium]|nr:anion permease [Lachnospiraceae bacterium]